MNLKEILVSLRRHFESLLGNNELKNKAYLSNQWFTQENIDFCINNWIESLSDSKIEDWIIDVHPPKDIKNVGIIMAGNIPMVGLHDLLCTVISGHKAIVKLSSNDEILIKSCIEVLNNNIHQKIEIKERIKNTDAIIATGSNNSIRYFEYYFKDIPHIIRNNRTSIAVLDGTETEEELKLLSIDIFSYFGLGCRNVTKLLVPVGYNFPHLLDQWQNRIVLIDHNKYANNYTYHKALYLMNIEDHFDTGYVLVRESQKLSSGVANLLYSTYTNPKEVNEFIIENADNLQCVVGKGKNMLPFGSTQKTQLKDYADGKNTLDFIRSL